LSGFAVEIILGALLMYRLLRPVHDSLGQSPVSDS
jgi:hypothetical protein